MDYGNDKQNLKTPQQLKPYVDDGSKYIFPAGEAAPGAAFAPPTPVAPTSDAVSTTLAAPLALASQPLEPSAIESKYNIPNERQPAQNLPGSTVSNDPNYFQQAYNTDISAANRMGNFEKDAYNRIAGQDAEAIKANQDFQKRQEDYLKKFDEGYKTLSEDVNSKKLDSRRWWKDKSTGDKVLTMVGMALSAVNPNSFQNAMTAIDKTIERDINDQKSDIETGRMKLQDAKTLYAENIRRFGDERAALAATRMMNADVIKNQLNANLAGVKGEVAKANGLKMLGQVEQYQQNQKVQMMKLLKDAQKDTRGLQVAGFQGQAPSEKDASDLRSMNATAMTTLDSLKELEKITKTPGKSLDRELRSRGAQLSQDIQLSLKEIKKLGVLSGDDAKRLDDYIQDPTSFFSSDKKSMTLINGAKDLIQKSVNMRAKSLGMASDSQSISSFRPN